MCLETDRILWINCTSIKKLESKNKLYWKTKPHTTTPTSTIRELQLLSAEGGKAARRNSAVSSDCHLQIGHQWSDRQRLNCFQFIFSSRVGLFRFFFFFFFFLWPVLKIFAAHVTAIVCSPPNQILPPGGGFPYLQDSSKIRAQRVISSPCAGTEAPGLC